MVNRPSGGARSQRWEKSQYDFYREENWVNEAIFNAIDFGPKDNLDLIWDGSCGTGSTLDVAKQFGHQTIGSDIVDRQAKHKFFRGNILQITSIPKPPEGKAMSYLSNPPYSYQPDICEKIMRRTMDWPLRRAVFIVPIAFLNGQARWRFFMEEFNPSHVLIYSRRPTMPPGHLIDEMATPFEGGMADYCAIAFSGPRHKWRTELRWLKP